MKIKNIILGIGLVVVLWVLNTFIAFNVFSPTRDSTSIILVSWIIVDSLTIFLLRKLINKEVLLSVGLFVGFLVILYIIPIDNNIPDEALDLNKAISERNLDRYNYAQELFEDVEKKWTSPIREYLRQPNRVLGLKSFAAIWETTGYVDSSLQTQVYFKLLIESGRFDEFDVKIVNGYCTNSPHRYLEFENGTFADLWAVDNFQDYKFGQFTPYPCDELQ